MYHQYKFQLYVMSENSSTVCRKNNRDLLKVIYSNLKCRRVNIFLFQTLKFPRFSEDIKNMQIEFSGCGMYAFTFKFPFGYTIADSVQPCYNLRWHRKAYSEILIQDSKGTGLGFYWIKSQYRNSIKMN